MRTITTTATGTITIRRGKKLYAIVDDINGGVIAADTHYSEEMAEMWAMRILAWKKKTSPNLRHATLWQYGEPYGMYKIRGFKRAD